MALKTIYPSADSYPYYYEADTVNNDSATLKIYSNWAAFPEMKFTGIPSGTITSAYLKAYYIFGANGPLTTSEVHVLTTDWTPATMTWNTGHSTIGDSYGTLDLTGGDGWKTSTDLKTLIEYWQSNDNYGLAVVGEELENAVGTLDSIEGTYPPYLEITVPSAGGGFSGFSPWIFMKDMWEEHNKLWLPKKKILIPEGI